MNPWHCIETASRFESSTAADIAALGIPAHCPSYLKPIKDRTRFSRPLILAPFPLFPGYLFARFSPSDSSSHAAILRTRRVRQVLGIVRDSFFFGPIFERQEPEEIAILKGDKVRCVGGPFAGIASGVVEWSEGDRIRLLLDAVGKPRVTIPRAHVALA